MYRIINTLGKPVMIVFMGLSMSAAIPVYAGEIPMVVAPVSASAYVVRGIVVDDSNEPLPGATVIVKGTKTATSTDLEGNFELRLPSKGSVTLIVSYVGMKTREITTVTGSRVDIVLETSPDMLEEVIVSGFQTISRERNTGSAIVVGADRLAKVQAPDLSSKLEGITPGLTFYNNEISIRGNSSLSISSTPLLVVDGQPATGMSLDDLNPNIIESVTVLKDAAATSLYGVYASNGVIVVTTKRGTDRKLEANVSLSWYYSPAPSLDYRHYASTGDIIDLESQILTSNPDYISNPSAYFATKTNISTASYMSGVDMLYYKLTEGSIDEAVLNASLTAMRNKDYRREYYRHMMQGSLTQDYNVTLNTGSDRYNFYAALRYQKPGHYTRDTDENRLSYYMRNDITAASWLKLSVGANLMIKKDEFSEAQGLGATAAMPYDMLYDAEGNLAYRYLYNQVLAEKVNETDGLEFMGYNAIEESRHNRFKTDDMYMKYFLQANFDILPGLDIELKGQYEKRKVSGKVYDEPYSYTMRAMINEFASVNTRGGFDYNIPQGGRLYTRDTNYDNYNVRVQANYRATFDEKHQVTALVGAEARQDHSDQHIGERYGYDDKRLTYSQVDWLTLSKTGVVGQLYGTARTKSENLSVSDVKHRYVSAYLNAGYVYDSRYSVNGSVRVEQADLFGSDPKYRYRPLWSVGGSWNIEKEEFMHDYTWLDMLKFRVTYGITGMVDQSSSPYLLASFGTSLFSNGPVTIITTPPNSSLRWEKTSTFNAGIDFMFMGRLSGTVDVYRKYSSDLLVNKSIDPSLGFGSTARANNGSMRNTGIEISLSYDWIKNRDFAFTTSLSAAYNDNRIEKIDYDPTDALDMMRAPTSNYRAGDAYNSLYAYRYAGLTTDGNPSVYNENGDVVAINPVRNINALVCVGQLSPKWNGALNLDFRWRDLSVFAKVVYYAGHSLRVDVPVLYDSTHKILDGAVNKGIVDRWTPDNTDAQVPVMGTYSESGERNEHWRYADVNTASASFIKLRNIGVAYTFPTRLLRATHVFQSAQARFQVDNLCYWASNSHGIDPESFNANLGTRTDRQAPTYTFGLNFSF